MSFARKLYIVSLSGNSVALLSWLIPPVSLTWIACHAFAIGLLLFTWDWTAQKVKPPEAA